MFLYPSEINNENSEACNHYRACAGTKPYNLAADSPEKTGKNDGAFWFQSWVRPSKLTDGAGSTAMFSERCLGSPDGSGPLGDYYRSPPTIEECDRADPDTARRFGSSLEWSGQRWGDGNVFYTRYHGILPPNRVSCNFGSRDDNGQTVVTASSRHPGGVNVLTGDGSVRFVKETIAAKVWRALSTISGRETVSSDSY